VLYASQTGNALDAAERIGREAERRGLPASVVSTDEFDTSSLPHHEEAVVFVVSTTGQGDSPDSFKAFWRFLLQRNLGNYWLQQVRYAVFGLGDSGYQKYNVSSSASLYSVSLCFNIPHVSLFPSFSSFVLIYSSM
jgi:sulfite reductase alpha subunit-like flavoprotein